MGLFWYFDEIEISLDDLGYLLLDSFFFNGRFFNYLVGFMFNFVGEGFE